MKTQPPADRRWHMKKAKLRAVLQNFAARSPMMRLIAYNDLGEEIRAIVLFDTKTLVREPGGAVHLDGPVLAGIRYHQSFMSVAPIPWEIVTILSPPGVFHPNTHSGGGLCLGHPLPNISMEEILHTTWAAIVMNTKRLNVVDWQGFNPAAAAYVKAHLDQFPLTRRGLLEQTEPSDSQEDRKP